MKPKTMTRLKRDTLAQNQSLVPGRLWRASLTRFAICFLLLILLPVTSTQAQENRVTEEQIQEWIDLLLKGKAGTPAEMLDLAQRTEAAITKLDNVTSTMRARSCMAIGTAHYLAESPAAALTYTERCYDDALEDVTDTVQLRLDAFMASMLMANGRVEEALVRFKAMLARDNSNAEPAAVLRARTNYGAALQETGQVLAAIETYQSVLEDALKTGNEVFTLAVANNLIILLIEQQMYDAASMWEQRVQPFMSMDVNPVFIQSISLHSLQLKSLMGDPAGAAAKLENFIDAHPNASGLIKGSAYELLADAYRQLGRLDESYDAAVRGVDLLRANPVESADARLVLARTLIAQEKYPAAILTLATMQMEPIRPPIVREQIHELRTRALLGLKDADDIAAQFEEYVLAGKERAMSRARQDIRYFDAQRTSLEQRDKIEQFEQGQRILQAEADASEALARESVAVANGARRARNLWIGFIVVAAFTLGFIWYLIERRTFARRLAEEQQILNEKLQHEVAEKSAALLANASEQAELEKALADKAHTQALGALTGNVAHDFNNLMQVVRIANEQLGRAATTPLQKSMLDGSNSALDHARDLIQQLLAYSRRQSLKIEPTNISHYIAKTKPLFCAAVGDQINLRVDDHSAGASAMVDASLLTTALLNLLSNSMDAMEGAGTITFSAVVTKIDHERPGKWTQLDAGEYLAISVEDSGHGMSPETLARACEPFFSGKEEGAGSGLGLSSVQGFARQSGGDLRIESVPGHMTRVVMMIPATSAAVLPSPDEVVLHDDLEALRVLLVEDNAALSRTLQAMLRQLSAKVEHVSSADDALLRLENGENFDIVLSDIRMQGEHDGYALFKEVRDRWPALPVLLMTGHSKGAQIDGAMVLNKPFSQNELVTHLRRLTARSESTVDG